MKNISLSLSASDVKVLLFSLECFASCDMADNIIQNQINNSCCVSAISKLSSGSVDITPNEYRVMYSSLLYIQCVCNGSISSDPALRSECSNYLFSVNALLSKLPEI